MRGGSDHFDPQLLTHTFRLQDGLASPDQGPLGMAGANDRARDGEGDASVRRRYVHSGLGSFPSTAVNAQIWARATVSWFNYDKEEDFRLWISGNNDVNSATKAWLSGDGVVASGAKAGNAR